MHFVSFYRDMRCPNTSYQRTQADNRVDIDNAQNSINSKILIKEIKISKIFIKLIKPINQVTPNNINKSKNKGNEMKI